LSILFKATGFKHNTAKYYINNTRIGVEVYVCGAAKRVATVTGNVYRNGDIMEAADKLQILLDRFMLRPVKKNDKNQKFAISYLSDHEVLRRVKTAKRSANCGTVKSWKANHKAKKILPCVLISRSGAEKTSPRWTDYSGNAICTKRNRSGAERHHLRSTGLHSTS
jgi:hypothetical protein